MVAVYFGGQLVMKNKLYCNRTVILAACIVSTALLANNAGAVNTQIQTDKTLQGITARNVDAPGNNQVYTLSEINGKTAGKNLFYSFSNFNIGATDTAWFNLNSPDLANVISRVTGGSESFIEGALKMTNVGSAPAFFFINSAGITFGAGASVDVPGAFYTSTVSALNLSDGSQYLSSEADASTLSAADPESFGFLGDESGKINIGSSKTARTNLTFAPGTDVGFVANQIQIDDATVANADTSQAGINLQIVATGDEAAQIKLGTLVDDQAIAGKLNIQNSDIDASGNGSGSIAVRSGNFNALDSSLIVNNSGNTSMTSADGVNVLVDSQLDVENTSIKSVALGVGNAGLIDIKADSIDLGNNGLISSTTTSQGNAGAINVTANQLKINGVVSTRPIQSFFGIQPSSGIMSQSGDLVDLKSTGNAGDITVTVSDSLKLFNHAAILSNTSSKGKAGTLMVNAGSLEMDSSIITSQSAKFINGRLFIGNTGNAGNVNVNIQDTLKLDFSDISSQTTSKGNAGDVSVSARQLDMFSGSKISSQTVSGNFFSGGSVFSGGSEQPEGISDELIPDSLPNFIDDMARGDSGDVEVRVTDHLKLMTGSRITSSSLTQGTAGTVSVYAGQLEINNGNKGIPDPGRISSETLLNADNDIEGNPEGGDAGTVIVTVAGKIKLVDRGSISTDTFALNGKAGEVRVSAGEIEIDNSKISSSSHNNYDDGLSTGAAGNVMVIVKNTLKLENGSSINANALTDNIVTITPGEVSVTAKNIELNKSSITSTSTSSATIFIGDRDNAIINDRDGGSVTVSATEGLKVFDGAQISSSTFSKGKAGNVTVNAGYLEMTGANNAIASNSKSFLRSGNAGDAGNVTVDVTKTLKLSDGGLISSSTESKGKAGTVNVNAGQMEISKSGTIESASLIYGDNRRSAGDAGSVTVIVDDALNLMEDGTITSKTESKGKAGVVTVSAGQLKIDHAEISSGADVGSRGRTGNIIMNVNSDIQLGNDAKISVENNAITTDPDVPAGNITINLLGSSLRLDSSQITSQGRSGHGGSITINDGELLYLRNSPITTSVFGQSGNGGTINITSNALIMDTGFIQANTIAPRASGGRVNINVPAIIPSGGLLLRAGDIPLEFQAFSGLNVIQSAAPNGISGVVNISTPQLNLSGMLTNLAIEPIDSNAMNRNMCTVDEGSSLFQSGKGGMRMRARDFLF
jgi:filamentous hemagglutinin family protein